MSRDRIRVSYMLTYPFVNPECSSHIPRLRVGSSCQRPGMAIEILNLITAYLNLTIDVVKVSPHISGWANTFDEVENNETDTYALLYSDNTPNDKAKFEFTKEVFRSNLKFIAKRADNSLKSLFDFFDVYHPNVWISIAVVFILFTTFGLLVRYVEFKLSFRKKRNFTEILWKMSRLQLMQAERIRYNLIAGRCSLLIFCVFQICLILSLFQSLILTSVFKKMSGAPFNINRLFHMFKENKMKLITASTILHYVQEEINNNYDFKKAVENNPYLIVDSPLGMIRSGYKGVTLIEEYTWFKYRERFCDLMAIKGVVSTKSDSYLFKSGSRFIPLFNDAIDFHKYKIRIIVDKYMKHRPPSSCESGKGGPMPLSINPYLGPLIILIAGILYASLVFAAELLRRKTRRKDNIPSCTNNSDI